MKAAMTGENGGMSAQPHGRADLLRDLQAGENQCTARSKRTGQRCKRPSSLGSNVCRSHGSEAPQTRAKAQRRLAQAADVLVQRLLSLALDGDTPDNVALSAIIAALDRAGLSVKTAGTLEVTVKPFEKVFERIAAGPRDPQTPALAIESQIATTELGETDENGVIVGEIDDDEIHDDPYLPPGFHQQCAESQYTDAHTDAHTDAGPLDVEILDPSLGDLSHDPPTTGPGVSSLSVDAGPQYEGTMSALGGPLGPRGPMGNWMLSLQDAVEVAARMRHEAAARQRAEAIRLREARRR